MESLEVRSAQNGARLVNIPVAVLDILHICRHRGGVFQAVLYRSMSSTDAGRTGGSWRCCFKVLEGASLASDFSWVKSSQPAHCSQGNNRVTCGVEHVQCVAQACWRDWWGFCLAIEQVTQAGDMESLVTNPTTFSCWPFAIATLEAVGQQNGVPLALQSDVTS